MMSCDVNRCQCSLHRSLARLVIAIAVAACTTSSVLAQSQRTREQDEAVATARKTLSATLSTPVDRWQLVSVSPAEWRDSSLGCPERGKAYTPALTSGFTVTLRDAGTEHIVHVSAGRAVVCTSRSEPRLPPDALVSSSMAAGDAVRAEIARALKIAPAQVRITSVRPARKGDKCAPADPSGAGHIVEARVDAKTLRYYRDAAAIRPCEPDAKR